MLRLWFLWALGNLTLPYAGREESGNAAVEAALEIESLPKRTLRRTAANQQDPVEAKKAKGKLTLICSTATEQQAK